MNIRHTLGGNLRLKALALALAILLWCFAMKGEETELAVSVPVRLVHLPPGLEAAGNTPDRLDVRIAVPKLLVGRVKPETLAASLDLSQAREGSLIFSSLDRCLNIPAGVRVVRVQPATVELSLRKASP